MTAKPVWCEMNGEKVNHVFRTKKAASKGDTEPKLLSRQDAVYSVRRQVFDRAAGLCERCSKGITWDSGHLHETKHKGQGGDVSVANCEALCEDCHTGINGAHGNRRVQWSTRKKS